MLKIFQLFLMHALFMSIGSLFADEQSMVTIENIYNRSELWPLKVSLIGKDDDQPSRFPGILVRIEEDGTVLVDFGRNGLKRVSVKDTDLIENANKVLEGKLVKDFPNFIEQSANLFLTRQQKGQTLEPIKPEKLLEYEKMLLVYCNESILTDKCWSSYKILLNDFKCVVPLIIPTKMSFYRELNELSEWSGVHIIIPHALVPSLESFQHYPILESGGLTFVLIDLEGKIYDQWHSYAPKTHSKILKEVVLELEKFEGCNLESNKKRFIKKSDNLPGISELP